MFSASTSGVELQVAYFVDAPLHSQIMPDIESARVLSQHWLEAVRAASKDDKAGHEISLPRLQSTD
jgi:hypothetical protein